ncbi:hypothetical protein BO70DRAFT_428813 [Aspergillus heteromorphus CBS 117.55]|uniref:Uncharacterized protein n=1 Tax=Aspergillus heteromorphus CBS 117.55 TaxID=1448321 RepID=A0A317WCN8_9EURO|nr:uncharacterized protein BO70DRAFT_428813 [Aspergillus heteromorphus CBS 117.55]PWY83531.1 hypothetical protein BO70DRAFT_428813 [Aspergillus heteromorphus CBS 117.55]
MLQRSDSHENLVAPSPIVPTCRPSSQIPRSGYTAAAMSATPQPQPQPHTHDEMRSSESIDMRSDSVTDFVKFIEAPIPPNGSTGARDMIKAGQRRLRQLAQRPKKTTDPRVKAEEAARQLAALQEGGFLPSAVHPPVSLPRRSGHKKSLDSSRSSSRSISNLSFKSTSRRDVEIIGQPWLTDPLEKKDSKQLSSVDLRQLTSLVESAVSLPPQLDDTSPPPYQPPTPAKDPRRDMRHLTQPAAPQDTVADITPGPDERHLAEEKSISSADSQDQTELSERKEPSVLSSSENSSSEGKMPGQKNRLNPRPNASTKTTELPISTEAAKPLSSTSSASMQTSTSQPAPSLKLFPDTMPPRMSSKNAWRISNVRPLALNRPLPAAPDSKRASIELNAERPKPADKPLPKEHSVARKAPESRHSTPMDTRKSGNDPMKGPVSEVFPPKKSSRRPSSLPMGTIDAFPLPAPMRPLPSLPESTPAITICDRSAADKPASPERLVLDGKNHPAAPVQAEPTTSDIASEPLVSFVRAGQSRAERVHALKMRDLSASRIYLKDPEKPEEGGEQVTQSEKYSQETAPDRAQTIPPNHELESPTDGPRRYQRKVASEPPSPPPLSPPPSKPSRHLATQSIGRRYCSTPISSLTESVRDSDLFIQPLSETPSQEQWSSSTGSRDATAERASKEPVNKSEMPIPSSDDDCTGGSTHNRTQPTSGKRRRVKPEPLTLGEPSSRKGRTGKKVSDYGFPLTPMDPRARMFDGASPQSYRSHSTHNSHDSRSSNHHHHQYLHIIQSLEGRVAHLERHNKVLQAALLAALDVGMKENLESVLGGSATSLSTSSITPPTGRSFSSATNGSSLDGSVADDRKYARSRQQQPPFRPTSWIASPESSRRGSYDSDDSAHVRELEDMIEDFDFDWTSDKSDPQQQQQSRPRAFQT